MPRRRVDPPPGAPTRPPAARASPVRRSRSGPPLRAGSGAPPTAAPVMRRRPPRTGVDPLERPRPVGRLGALVHREPESRPRHVREPVAEPGRCSPHGRRRAAPARRASCRTPAPVTNPRVARIAGRTGGCVRLSDALPEPRTAAADPHRNRRSANTSMSTTSSPAAIWISRTRSRRGSSPVVSVSSPTVPPHPASASATNRTPSAVVTEVGGSDTTRSRSDTTPLGPSVGSRSGVAFAGDIRHNRHNPRGAARESPQSLAGEGVSSSRPFPSREVCSDAAG